MDIAQRQKEALREQSRLQDINMRLIKEISRIERDRVDGAAEIRRKADREIETFNKKIQRDIDALHKDQRRTENLLRSNEMQITNFEREQQAEMQRQQRESSLKSKGGGRR